MANALTWQSTSIDDGILFVVNGDVDFSCSTELRRVINDELGKKPSRLIVDLAGVKYMDSSGVAALVEALRTQAKAQRKLVLCQLQQRVRGIFEIARLTTVFTITETVDEAKSV